MPKKRLWINITTGLVFLSLAATGILLFLVPYNSLFSGVHVWFGICFLIISAFHIKINFRSLVRYIKNKLTFFVAATAGILFCIIVLSVNYRLQPFSSVLDFGKKLRKTAIIEEMHSQTILIDRKTAGSQFFIEVKVGEKYRDRSIPFFFGKEISSPPQFVFWLESPEGEYLETIFVTAKTGFPILYPDDKFRSNIVYRQEAFPYWLHKRNKKLENKEALSTIDGITGATPHAHFNIETNTPNKLKKFRVLAEVNRSFDFNDYYTKEKYPGDPIYNGDGYPGQPSIIYAVNIDLTSNNKTFVMKPIGHGHYSGANGKLYTDMTGIDSALDIFQRVLVERR